jgi:hypothetical protein
VARILAGAGERRIVVVDPPEDGLPGTIERSQIALLVRIIVGRECVEQFDLFANRRLIARRGSGIRIVDWRFQEGRPPRWLGGADGRRITEAAR